MAVVTRAVAIAVFLLGLLLVVFGAGAFDVRAAAVLIAAGCALLVIGGRLLEGYR